MQLSLWGNPSEHPFSSPMIVPCYDTAIVTAEWASGERLRVHPNVQINGEEKSRRDFPEFAQLDKRRDLLLRTLGRLSTTAVRCLFCGTRMRFREEIHDDPLEDNPGWPELRAIHRLDFCQHCRYWRINELWTETRDIGALLCDGYSLTTLSSKLRTFDENAPEGTLDEVAQWFRQHPRLYNTVSPAYLEKLVARIFTVSGQYVEVQHVGRPDDGGVDVVLVESESRSWLVQVKRRENATAAESVSTIRNLLGAMILQESRLGIVVSTADHFTFRARESAAKAGSLGFKVELIDRKSLDAMLARALPAEPWKQVLSDLNSQRQEWFYDYYGNANKQRPARPSQPETDSH